MVSYNYIAIIRLAVLPALSCGIQSTYVPSFAKMKPSFTKIEEKFSVHWTQTQATNLYDVIAGCITV